MMYLAVALAGALGALARVGLANLVQHLVRVVIVKNLERL